MAIAIELVRNTIQHFKYLKTNPFRGIPKIVLSTNLKFIIFAVGYPSSYRVIALHFFFLSNFRCSQNPFCSYSPACSMRTLDVSRKSATYCLHFYRVYFSMHIQTFRSSHTPWLAPLRFYGSATISPATRQRSRYCSKSMRCQSRNCSMYSDAAICSTCAHFTHGKHHPH